MKFIIALLLATTQAKHHRHHQHTEDDGLVFVSAESQQGSWLKRRLVQLEQQETHKKWNANDLGVMDADEYQRDVRTAMDTIVFDVEKPKAKVAAKKHEKKADKPVNMHPYDKVADFFQEQDMQSKQTQNDDGSIRRSSSKTSETFGQMSMGEMIANSNMLVSRYTKDKLMEAEVTATQAAIAAVQQERDQAQKQLSQLKAQESRELDNKISEMNHQWTSFCTTLDTDKWQKAQEMWASLEQSGHAQPLLKANTKELYAKAFKFDDTARNDYAVDQLNTLDIAQQNLNANSDNKRLLGQFIATAQQTAVNLKAKYSQYWDSPVEAGDKKDQNEDLLQLRFN